MSFNPRAKAKAGVLALAPYIAGTSIAEARQQHGAGDYAKLASNENPLGMSPMAAAAIREFVAEAFRYPESSAPAVRAAVATREGLTPQHVVVGNGSDGVMYALGLCFLGPGDRVVVPEVTFSLYAIIARSLGCEVVTVPMPRLALDPQAVLDYVTPETAAVFLCNPNNPTGQMLDADTTTRLLREIPEDVLVVHDEVYREFAPPDAFADTSGELRNGRANLFVLRSFSKAYGLAGVRVGYGLGSPEIIELVHRVRPPFDASVLAQHAAVAALGDSDFLRKTLALTDSGRGFLCGELDRLGVAYLPSATNFLLVHTGIPGFEAADALMRRGLIVRAWRGGPLHNYIRVTFDRHEVNQRLVAALAEVLHPARAQ